MEIIQKRFYRKNYPLPKNKQAALLDSEWRRLVCVGIVAIVTIVIIGTIVI